MLRISSVTAYDDRIPFLQSARVRASVRERGVWVRVCLREWVSGVGGCLCVLFMRMSVSPNSFTLEVLCYLGDVSMLLWSFVLL